MVMKTWKKTTRRMFKKHFLKIFLLMAIIALGVGLTTGLGAVSFQLKESYSKYLTENDFYDLNLKTSKLTGFTNDDINTIKDFDFVDNVYQTMSFDNDDIRVYAWDFKVDYLLKLEAGRLPSNASEVVIHTPTISMQNYNVGDEIDFNNNKLLVVGIVSSPIYIYQDEISNNDNSNKINSVIFLNKDFVSIPYVKTDLLISFNTEYEYFTKNYKNEIDCYVSKIIDEIGTNDLYYLTYDEIITLKVVAENSKKMFQIGLVFPIFFTIVILVVALSTMTRIIEDDRIIIGTFLSLGFSQKKVELRYYLIIMFSAVLGSFIGITLGYHTLARLIYLQFKTILFVPKIVIGNHYILGLISTVILTLTMVLVVRSLFAKLFKEEPANLLRLKAPKPGGKIFIERISIIWKRLSFKYKSSLRNIFRYKLNFIMTIISVSGSTALLFAGLALFDNIKYIKGGSFASLNLIATIIIIAAAALSILVTYNLTNMNIEERKREIATLKVLGYKKSELLGYIYRETFINATIGIIIGLPLGYVAVKFIFDYINIGEIRTINYYIWILTFILAIIFIIITDLLLIKKINEIDMNDSLKVIE